jgi:hypothetical protein
MVLGVVLLTIIFVLHFLLVRGALWKLILFFGGWWGLHLFLQAQPWATASIMTIGHYGYSWAEVIPTIICFLALITTKDV